MEFGEIIGKTREIECVQRKLLKNGEINAKVSEINAETGEIIAKVREINAQIREIN